MSLMFRRTSQGVRITVHPFFLPSRSSPVDGRHVFAYEISIENLGGDRIQLRWRHWRIHDPIAGDSEVEGDGVVGEQPVIPPGGLHEYQSFCVLAAPQGYMEGFYEFDCETGPFRAEIPRFALDAAEE